MSCLIKARGLPFRATATEICNFFAGCDVSGGVDGVSIIYGADGRPSGEAIVQFTDEANQKAALAYHRQIFPGASRYVECYPCSEEQAADQLSKQQAPSYTSGILKLRGLPFQAKAADVVEFFAGFGCDDSDVTFGQDTSGRPSGEAWVHFPSSQQAEAASAQMNGNMMGNRYIEIYPANEDDVATPAAHSNFKGKFQGREQSAGLPYDEMSGYIRLRGLPFNATVNDIQEFLSDCGDISPNHILITQNAEGRPSGEAFVMLTGGELLAQHVVSTKHKQHMGTRFIEVFAATWNDVNNSSRFNENDAKGGGSGGKWGAMAMGKGGKGNSAKGGMSSFAGMGGGKGGDPWGGGGGSSWTPPPFSGGGGGGGGGKWNPAAAGGRTQGGGDEMEPAGDYFHQLVQQIKQMQRKSEETKALWIAWVAKKGKGGKRDPACYDEAFLQQFLASVQSGEAIEVANNFGWPPEQKDPEAAPLVEEIKRRQRNSDAFKQSWTEYCFKYKEGLKDPQRHDAASLKLFLDNEAPEEEDEPTGGWGGGGGGGGGGGSKAYGKAQAPPKQRPGPYQEFGNSGWEPPAKPAWEPPSFKGSAGGKAGGKPGSGLLQW